MFSKAKRFESLAIKTQVKAHKLKESDKQKPITTTTSIDVAAKSRQCLSNCSKTSEDTRSQCSSSTKSVTTKAFKTPIPVKVPSSLKRTLPSSTLKNNTTNELLKAQEVEIRNKDHTIKEYNRQIEDLKNEISCLHIQLSQINNNNGNTVSALNIKLSEISLNEKNSKIEAQRKLQKVSQADNQHDYDKIINELQFKINTLEEQCHVLEQEASSKQVELSFLEEVISIRDSLCKDLQIKLSNLESCLEETKQRLEMVKEHHILALEANESIRLEFKAELETLKLKHEEEKLNITTKNKSDQENIKTEYNSLMESIKNQLSKEKNDAVEELQKQLVIKEEEMKAKLDQIDEATHEKLRLCEIQFEERSCSIQEHCSQQQKNILALEKELKDLGFNQCHLEDQNLTFKKEINKLKLHNESLKKELNDLNKENNNLKEQSKQTLIDFENKINKLTFDADKAIKEKKKFEMSLTVTRDIVNVLTIRLRESDSELEHLEGKIKSLTDSKEQTENELASLKNTLNNTVVECNEYKEALINILKSKAVLAKEHNHIMEHNVSLIESLQNVEMEAYRELGSIKNDFIEDVELLKKESNSQIVLLREEVEKKRVLCKMATENASHAAAAAEQSRVLLEHAAREIARLEADHDRCQQQIQDQQSLVVELSLLRQENEELTMTVAKQTSIIDKMKRETEQMQNKPKSPSVLRKSNKIGKENIQSVMSPLRERNHLVEY